jgi:hypothetical protein
MRGHCGKSWTKVPARERRRSEMYLLPEGHILNHYYPTGVVSLARCPRCGSWILVRDHLWTVAGVWSRGGLVYTDHREGTPLWSRMMAEMRRIA